MLQLGIIMLSVRDKRVKLMYTIKKCNFTSKFNKWLQRKGVAQKYTDIWSIKTEIVFSCKTYFV